ncbi:MAG: hypothetical protein V1882_08520 [Candidatus Omnitrophota bacterium]
MKKVMFILGMAFAGYLCYALIEMTEKFFSFQTALDIVIFTSVIGCFIGLWKSKRWALWLSWVLAAAAFIWGCYLIHFVWTFWIFAAPTLMERIGNVLNPRVSVFVVFPAVWLFYFTRAKVRALFA